MMEYSKRDLMRGVPPKGALNQDQIFILLERAESARCNEIDAVDLVGARLRAAAAAHGSDWRLSTCYSS